MKKLAKYLLMTMLLLGSLLGATNTNTTAKVTLKVGYLPILDHLTLLVSHAKDNDSFQQVEIQPKQFKSWDELVGALKAGVLDAAFIMSPLAMDLFNHDTAIKTVLLAHRDGSAVTVKKDSPIHSAAELKGKTIAIPHKKATHVALLNHYLMGGGLSLKDVITKMIAPPNMEPAMQQGSIDAFIVAEPFGAKAQNDGVGRILVLSKDIINHHVECVVVVTQKTLTNHPAAVQEWVASLIRAGQWIEQDKQANGSKQVAQLTTKKYLPHSEAIIIGGLQNPSDRISYLDLKPVVKDFQTIEDISIQAGILDKVKLEEFIDDRFYRDSTGK
jgi:NitT/TauT family transport system substrate-binding protein